MDAWNALGHANDNRAKKDVEDELKLNDNVISAMSEITWGIAKKKKTKQETKKKKRNGNELEMESLNRSKDGKEEKEEE